ncbi:MAG TPA: hypothetical protein VFF65_01565 [Phycisphaerales bacterium]|nr:hypothetical protein [Phycisphaerales bacterium]
MLHALTRRRIGAFSLLFCSAASLTGFWSGCRSGGTGADEGSEVGGAPLTAPLPSEIASAAGVQDRAGWTPAASADLATPARAAAAQLAERGLDARLADAFARDAAAALDAVARPDFDAFERSARARGQDYDHMATGFCDSLDAWKLYPAEPSATPAASRDLRERLRAAWNDPAPRGMKWQDVRPAAVRSGLKMTVPSGSTAWPHTGYYAQLSLLTPPGGRLTADRAAELEKSGRTAWLAVPVRFSDGVETSVRLVFMYDDGSASWLPLSMVVGNTGEAGRVPMI